MADARPSHDTGIVYARNAQGFLLPVIDVTHAAFAVEAHPRAVAELRSRFAHEQQRRSRVPRLLVSWLLRRMGRRSRFARALFGSGTRTLPGEVTYALKLGAPNLVPPFDSPIDRVLAASLEVTSMRIRLQQLAQLLAAGLAAELAADTAAPLHLLNIAGGTAIDSLNALIVLRRQLPAALRRPITIHVLDPDAAGPEFGRQALEALLQGRLRGLTVQMRHVPYDWRNPAPLEELAQRLGRAEAIVVASSEGGLFEYADDDVVLGNLKALRAGVRLIAGSVTRADALARGALRRSPIKLCPRGADGLAPLALRAGFAIVRAEAALLSDQVLLRPL